MAESAIPPLRSDDPRVSAGAFTYGNPRFMLWGEHDAVAIGKFCSIAEEVTLFGGGEHRPDWVTTFPLSIALGLDSAWRDGHPATKGRTEIGNDVWIGYRATVLSGVHIGDGAVVGACAVVAKDVPPYAIVAGNPAKILRYRFEPAVIEELLRIRWWDWPLDHIKAAAGLMSSSDIGAFLACARTLAQPGPGELETRPPESL